MARVTIPAVVADQARRASWATAVKGNDEDHETRLLVVEAAKLLVATVTLTDAQIKALPTTPVTIQSAPVSGKRIKILGPITFQSNTSAGAYTNIDSTYSSIQVETTDGTWLSTAVTNDSAAGTPKTELTSWLGAARLAMFDQPAPYMEANGGYIQQLMTGLPSNHNGLAIRLAMDNNGTGNLTGGNAGNSLTVTFQYVLQAVA